MARTIAGHKEADAVEAVYSVCYSWYRAHGTSSPKHSDLDIRLCEEATMSPVAKAVLAWLEEHDTYSIEGERRYKVAKLAYNKLAKRYN